MIEPRAVDGYVHRYLSSCAHFVQTARHEPSTFVGGPSSDAWSAEQIVHHLLDMEIVSALRIRQAIACCGVSVGAVDQDAWMAKLNTDRSIESSFAALTSSRASTAELLRSLEESQWNNHVVHEASGPVTVRDLVDGATAHADEHRATLQMMWFQRLVSSQ